MRKDGITQAKAKQLRRNLTEAEKILWTFLRNQQSGYKFRRQQPIDHYIADFVCLENRMIIEVDGGQHNAERDEPRTTYLEQQGFRVIRFWNNDVMTNQEGVFQHLLTSLGEKPPHPGLLPQGEKEMVTA